MLSCYCSRSLSLLVFALLLLPAQVTVAAFSYDRFMLRLKQGVDHNEFIQALNGRPEGIGYRLERRIGKTLLVTVTPSQSQDAADALMTELNALPAVVYAELPVRLKPQFIPNDTYYSSQWHLFESYGIDAQNAWDRTRGSTSVVIGQIDTGILTHEDLDSSRVLPGYDFVSDPAAANDGDGIDPDPTDPGDAVAANECGTGTPAEDSSWHGLHVAGIMTATTGNATGVAGVDHAAKLLPIRALGKCGGDFLDILTGMTWAAGIPVSGVPTNPNPADVINLSFSGTGSCSPGIQDIVDQVRVRGVVLVAAAGNAVSGQPPQDVSNSVPANCNGVIAVAATNRAGDLAAYSNYGNGIDLSAPGGDSLGGIVSTYNTGTLTAQSDTYAALAGTSLATAQVSAAVAMMLSVDSALAPDTAASLLINSAQAFPAGSSCSTAICGAGILDLDKALELAAQQASASANTSSGGGGGGCVLDAHRRPDAGLLLLLLTLFMPPFRRRRN